MCQIFRDGLLEAPQEAVMNYLVAITSVCHQWREITINHSQLWNDIKFSAEEQNPTTCRGYIEAQFERSSPAKFSFCIDLAGCETGTHVWLVPLLHSHIHRCCQLNLIVLDGQYPKGLFPLPSHLPSLEELEVTVDDVVELWKLDLSAPLRVLSLEMYGPIDFLKHIPYTQLQHLSLRNIDYDEPINYFPILSRQSNLVSLALRTYHKSIDHNDRLILPHLTRIELSQESEPLWPKIQTPSLRHIATEECDALSFNWLAEITDLRNITSLMITQSKEDDTVLPSMQDYGLGENLLAIEMHSYPSATFWMLADFIPSKCPKLRLVRIHTTDWSEADAFIEAIDRFLSSTTGVQVQQKILPIIPDPQSPKISEHNMSRFVRWDDRKLHEIVDSFSPDVIS